MTTERKECRSNGKPELSLLGVWRITIWLSSEFWWSTT